MQFQVPMGNSGPMASISEFIWYSEKIARQSLFRHWVTSRDIGFELHLAEGWLSDLQTQLNSLAYGDSSIPTIQWNNWFCILFSFGLVFIPQTAFANKEHTQQNSGIIIELFAHHLFLHSFSLLRTRLIETQED